MLHSLWINKNSQIKPFRYPHLKNTINKNHKNSKIIKPNF
ncbi:hypothetical protein PLUTE_b1308 [Pseudoalteromonas luteoviolacea DSM 6061]|nr:hypothetical protein [Pseudoalteromonas luteoviolacea DSM 6061]